jgi:hypothetical protein
MERVVVVVVVVVAAAAASRVTNFFCLWHAHAGSWLSDFAPVLAELEERCTDQWIESRAPTACGIRCPPPLFFGFRLNVTTNECHVASEITGQEM